MVHDRQSTPKQPTIRAETGVALVTSLAIIVVVAALILGSILTTQVELAVTRNDSTATQAQYVAEAGLQSTKAGLFQTFRWLEQGGSGSSLDACTNSLSDGIDFLRTGTATPWTNNRIVLPDASVVDTAGNEIGRYAVTLLRDAANENRITIRSVGRTLQGGAARVATATASATFVIRNSSTLEQAIFAGSGSGMTFINGNTNVYGGIYIVGDLSNASTVVLQSNGNLGIYNAYNKSGVGTFLRPEAQRSDNLCAALRVQSGLVAVGGSTQLGTRTNPLLTVAVSRGLGDISTDRGGTLECENNKGICTETPPGPFDIDAESAPAFPRLDEAPGTEFCPVGTWRSCVRTEAATDGLTLATTAGTLSVLTPAGAATGLPGACQTFLTAAAASASKALVFGNTSIDCRYTDTTGRVHGFEYVGSSPAQFNVFGNVNLRGFDMRFERAVNYDAVSRNLTTGASQPFAGISLERETPGSGTGGNFQANASFTTSSVQAFPDNVLSIVAERDANLRGGNNTFFTMPVYAGETFRMTSSSVLFGQVIANQFCTTNPGGNTSTCSTSGSPAEIVFVPTGENRAQSFRAIAPTGGLPTFTTLAYELR